jgi:hypothetical protein
MRQCSALPGNKKTAYIFMLQLKIGVQGYPFA